MIPFIGLQCNLQSDSEFCDCLMIGAKIDAQVYKSVGPPLGSSLI